MSAVVPVLLVPPGQHALFATVTEDDHRAWILVASALGNAFALVALLTRSFIRKFVNPGWALDDTLCVVASTMFFVQSGLVMGACATGLGSSIDIIPTALHDRVQKMYYASNIFFIVGLDLSKISSILFVRRLLSPGLAVHRYSTAIAAIIPVCTAAFLIATSLQCDLTHSWLMLDRQCTGWILRWQLHGTVTCLLELAIFVAPLWLLYDLQKPMPIKLEIATPFTLRLLVIVFTIIRLASFDESRLTSNPTLAEAPFITWTQAELAYSVIAATFPSVHRLVVDLITYYNGGQFGDSNSRSAGETLQMRPMRSGMYKSEVAASSRRPQRRSEESDGNNSQELIIRRDFSIEVKHETNAMR